MTNWISTPLRDRIDPTAESTFLLANCQAYERIVRKIRRKDPTRNPEAVLRGVMLAALTASEFHPGRFADGTIENLAIEIGAILPESGGEHARRTSAFMCKENRRRVLHVATQVLSTGGHTRMLHHWVRNDQTSCHSLALVNQRDVPVPLWLSEAVRNTGDVMILPPGASIVEKARRLKEIAKKCADLVVLHVYPSDVVPTVAFASHDCPPIALLNHADHQFWLGCSVSDIVINLRSAGYEHTAMRRFASENTVLPIPLIDSVQRLSPRNARRALGIPEDQVVLLSVGRAEKYRPCGAYDFVRTAGKILDRHSKAHVYIVGESYSGIARYLRNPTHERLHFVGSMEDPSLYRAAADIYLESFPFGSQTALLEAALSGLPVLPAYAPLFPLLVANDDSVRDLVSNPRDEQEYLERADLLVKYPQQRSDLGDRLRKRVLMDHVGVSWLDRLDRVYKQTDCLAHHPRPIPRCDCSATATDVGLTLWHARPDGETWMADTSRNRLGAAMRHSAFIARAIGDCAGALRFGLCAVRCDPHRRASWRVLALGLTLVGRSPAKLAQQVRRHLRRGLRLNARCT